MNFLLILSCCLLPLALPVIGAPDGSTVAKGVRAKAVQTTLGRCTQWDQETITEFERLFALDQILRGHPLTRRNSARVENGTNPNLKRRALSSASIPVAFHVISADDTAANGNVPDSQISRQVDALNNGFRPMGLTFNLRSTDRTVNPDWFANVAPDTAQQTAMKAALREGNERVLNIYTVGFKAATGLLGYATFPISYAQNPQDDGIVILSSSLPGGSTAGYDQGLTAVHETGHWVGLYHTFQGGCFSPGDHVDDTPPEAVPSQGCSEGRRTCPISDIMENFSDPIHNFMDYSPDTCMKEFTFEQAFRARRQLLFYRGVPYLESS